MPRFDLVPRVFEITDDLIAVGPCHYDQCRRVTALRGCLNLIRWNLGNRLCDGGR